MKKSLFVTAAVVVASSVISLTNSPVTYAAEICTGTAARPSAKVAEFIDLINNNAEQDPEIGAKLAELGAQNLNKSCSDEEVDMLFNEAKKIADEIIGRREAEAEARRQAEEDAKREAEEEAERERLLEEEAKKLAEEEAKKETEEKTEEKAEETTETPAEIAEEIVAASKIQAPNTGFEVKNFAAQIAGFFSLLAAATFAFIRKK